MKSFIPFFIVVAAILVVSPLGAAEVVVEARSDFTFSPSVAVIEAGDTVTWVNTGGFHNVAANDGSFRCANGCDGEGGNGDPSNDEWSFSRTFENPGEIGYFCEPHLDLGMIGFIVVLPQGQASTVRFTSTRFVADEGSVSARVTVERTGGDGGASVRWAARAGSAMAGADFVPAEGVLRWAAGETSTRSFAVELMDDSLAEDDETIELELFGPDGAATLGEPATAILVIADDDGPERRGRLAFEFEHFDVTEGTGPARVSVVRRGEGQGPVAVRVVARAGSAAAGADFTPSSTFLSWGDGELGRRDAEIEIANDGEAEPLETVELSLERPEGGVGLEAPSRSTLAILDDDGIDLGPCLPGPTTLCLGEGDRFKVEIAWRDFSDAEGLARVADVRRRDSGAFYFFTPDNLEILIKVLDACDLEGFGRFWVTLAGTTNLEFTATVVDTEAGEVRRYYNPLGQATRTRLDTRAFATCP